MEKKYTITQYQEFKESPADAADYHSKNQLEVEGKDFMQVSDDYHTMDELYHHRIVIYIALCKSQHWQDVELGCSSRVWRSKLHSDGNAYDGWFILGIDKEAGKQITYHLPMSEWGQTEFAETLDKAPKFDGHTAEDVLLRLNLL